MTHEDLVNFFVDFKRGDKIGKIANAHLAQSDKERNGAIAPGISFF